MEMRDGFTFLYTWHNNKERKTYIVAILKKKERLLQSCLHVYVLAFL
jgi:hypothetical protein